MLDPDVYAHVDALLGPTDLWLSGRDPGPPDLSQPLHTVYVSADAYRSGLRQRYGEAAREAIARHGPLPFKREIAARVEEILIREPVQDLRVDFEDGYGVRSDAEEDAAVVSVAAELRAEAPSPPSRHSPWVGVRCKSLEPAGRRRAIRTLDLFLHEYGPPPDGFVITLPKVSTVEQVQAMVRLCEGLEQAHGLTAGSLRFELQIETTTAVLSRDGTITLAPMLAAARGRCVGLHYGTYDFATACAIAAAHQSLAHPVADNAKMWMQLATAGSGVRVSDGSTNVLPVGDTQHVRAAWRQHARLVSRSLRRGFYQGWDLHPGQLPTRYGATVAFFRDGAAHAVRRLEDYLTRSSAGIADEPATARALAEFLLRGLHHGALTEAEVGLRREVLEAQWRR